MKVGKIKVLVTGVGSTTGISVIKGLRQQSEFEISVVGTDVNRKNFIAGSSFCDAFYQIPYAKDANYISTLTSICQSENIDILIPIVDPELLVVSKNKESFTQIGVTAIVSDADTIEICNDKLLTTKVLQQNSIPAPNTWLASEITNPKDLSYPIFVKPRDGISSINAFCIESSAEFTLAREKIPNLLVQEYLEGVEYTTDVMADLKGNVFAVVPRRRLATKAGISYKGETCFDETLINWGKRVAESLQIKGPANIQCMVSGDKISYFEINPRFSGSLPLTMAAGVNSPHWILKLFSGNPCPKDLLPFKQMVMARYWEEIFYPPA